MIGRNGANVWPARQAVGGECRIFRIHAEEADFGGIDGRSVLPATQHEIEQADHIRRTLRQDGQAVALGGVVAVVAGMIDSCYDKASVCQRLCSVIVTAEPTASTVRENNKRQLRPWNGTILYTRQLNIDGRRKFAERYIFRFAYAWIPNSASQVGTGIEKLYACCVGRRSQKTQCQGISKILIE